jgi:hypothetical protein
MLTAGVILLSTAIMPKRPFKKPAQFVCGPDTFQGLDIHSDGSQPAIRTQPLKDNPTAKEVKAEKRAKDKKVLHDMYQLNLKMVENAIKNKGKYLTRRLNLN